MDYWDHLAHSSAGQERANHRYVARVPLGNRNGRTRFKYFYSMSEYAAYLRHRNKQGVANENIRQQKTAMDRARHQESVASQKHQLDRARHQQSIASQKAEMDRKRHQTSVRKQKIAMDAERFRTQQAADAQKKQELATSRAAHQESIASQKHDMDRKRHQTSIRKQKIQMDAKRYRKQRQADIWANIQKQKHDMDRKRHQESVASQKKELDRKRVQTLIRKAKIKMDAKRYRKDKQAKTNASIARRKKLMDYARTHKNAASSM